MPTSLAEITYCRSSCSLPHTAAADGPKITYEEHVRPIFREHCFACHNQGKATNDLALDGYERIRKGGASGKAITPGNPDGSYLYSLVTHKDGRTCRPRATRYRPTSWKPCGNGSPAGP